jgi:zinc protease
MIEKYSLSNGIPVFFVPMHSSPVVTVQAWVTQGSAHETESLAGISHFIEHALFKGTRNHKVGEVAKEIESHGGEINAFTSFEQTAFYTTLASRYFENGLDVIADMIRNPTFDPEEMEREKEVILEEIKRSYDSAARTVSNNLWKTCFC